MVNINSLIIRYFLLLLSKQISITKYNICILLYATKEDKQERKSVLGLSKFNLLTIWDVFIERQEGK